MIIDVSNTIGKHKFKEEVKAEDLLKEMDKSGVDIAVISSFAECPDNESVKEAFTKYPNRFIGLYTINPWEDDAAEKLEKAINEGFKGLYMHPLRHGYMLCEHEVFYPLLEVCRKYQVPAWIYAAAEIFCNPTFFNEIASDFHDVILIMGRMGLQYDNASAVAIAKKYKNIYMETSGGMDFNCIRALKTVGWDRVMMGTGTPDAGYFDLEQLKIRNACKQFEEESLDYVFYKNAQRIFHIEGGE